MEGLKDLIANPLVWKILLSYWLFSAMVGSLNAPKPDSSELYQFMFRFLHALGGNINRAAMTFHVPGAKDEQL